MTTDSSTRQQARKRGSATQLWALVRLRWSMIRTRRVRLRVASTFGTVFGVFALLVMGGDNLPATYRTETLLLLPTAFLAFLVFTPTAAIAAGGGNEIVPADQLVAYPISARTQFLGSVVLAPLNIAWVLQVIGLLTAVGYVAASVRFPGVIGTLIFLAFGTTLGQAIAWGVTGVRQRRLGRLITWLILGVLIGIALGVSRAGLLTDLLDRSPTVAVVIGVLRPFDTRWWVTVAVLLAATVVVAEIGARICGWTLRRSGDTGTHRDAAPLARRPHPRSELAALIAVDRASVWRSVPLRRGTLVLGLLPGVAAAAAGLSWHNLLILPGLVAAGAALLFGVNAFSLEGSGAIWLASQPHRPALILAAKVWVITEVCVVSVLLAVFGGSLRAEGKQTWTTLAALLAVCAVSIVGAVALAARLSVTRPHRAALLGPRDTPAPPGTMAGYSLRLALRSTLVGILFVLASYAANPLTPTLLAVPFLLLSARSLVVTFRLWADVNRRSAVVTTVAYG